MNLTFYVNENDIDEVIPSKMIFGITIERSAGAPVLPGTAQSCDRRHLPSRVSQDSTTPPTATRFLPYPQSSLNLIKRDWSKSFRPPSI